MTTVLDSLFLRRPKLNYLSPAICEAVFSGSSSPIIILPEIAQLIGPTGAEFSASNGKFRLSWNRYPGALCYNVYTAVLTTTDILEPCSGLVTSSPGLQYVLLAECVNLPELDVTQYGCYRVSAITGEGETDLGAPTCTCDFVPPECPTHQHWDPYFLRCVCDDPICLNPGETWDAVLCQCVPCGQQHCPPGFFPIESSGGCLCVPSTYGPLTVYNSEQIAYCDPPSEGSYTVEAGAFSVVVYNPTADRVADAQREVDTEALNEAEDNLDCGQGFWDGLAWTCLPSPPVPDQIEYFADCTLDGHHFNIAALNSSPDPTPPGQIAGCACQAEGVISYTGPAFDSVIDFSTILVGPDAFIEVSVYYGNTLIFSGGSADPGAHTFTIPQTDDPTDIFIELNVQPVDLPPNGNGAAFLDGTITEV